MKRFINGSFEQDEFQMNMRLIGARNVNEIVPGMVDASALHSRVGLSPSDNLYSNTCEFIYCDARQPLTVFLDQPLITAQFKNKL